MRLHYYTQNDEWKNLGDWLTVPILRALGHDREPAAPGEPVLFGIGTILTAAHSQDTPADRIVAWGCGTESDGGHMGKVVDYRAVRGPLTASRLRARGGTPLGDPALLVPRLLETPPSSNPGEFLFVSHCGNEKVVPDGFDSCVSMRVKPEDARGVLARIAGATFVGSESLHGCILAAAYGVPWCLCSPRPWKTPDWSKYDDWFCLLGIPKQVDTFQPATRVACLSWWDKYGRLGRIPHLDPLLDSFPHGGL